MWMKPISLILLSCFFYHAVQAQNPAIIQYINKYKFVAIEEMKRSGVPASIKLAQGILETQAGVSDLVLRSNNHFGIKCKSTWTGSKVYHDDDERGECFRAYLSDRDSYKDHSDFLKNNQRYAFLFKIDAENYKGWAQGLKKAGYATNPRYWQQLVNYIEAYNLNLYTQIALGKKSFNDEPAMYAQYHAPASREILPAVVVTSDRDFAAPVQHTETTINEIVPAIQYPEGEFRINNTKVIFAPAGTSLLALAEQYHIKYKHLIDFNELPEDEGILTEAQLIYLQRKRKQGSKDVVVAAPGETVYNIAQKEGVRLESVLDYNNLKEDRELPGGARVYLQKKAAERAEKETEQVFEKPAYTGKQATNTYTSHIVQPKETLYAIAKKYNVELANIRRWNNLQDDLIKVGQELLIYKN
ncbi:MAG: glucosaminidase domain-containing protein [Chitinophagaceae bacterium]|nr:glucosaminidase domain-containing protein [Chitinophagaceae bacterium]MCW5926636.1 glucosaminidase domain-containing protein [Chitinophagaceae bacterium]